MPYFETVGGGSIDGPRYITTIDGKIQNKDIKLNARIATTYISTLPYEFYNGESVVYNNEIYILGGDEKLQACYKFNTNNWINVSSLPYEFKDGSSIVYRDAVHIMGSRINNNYTKHYNSSILYQILE